MADPPQPGDVGHARAGCSRRSGAPMTAPRCWCPIRCWPACPAMYGRCSSCCPRAPWTFTTRRAPGQHRLARIQDDIRHDRDPAASARLPHDGSVTIHACHGPARQVEVLREALLHLLDDDDTLQPRDIIVLCPDVDTFAPLISAAFGPHRAPHPGHRLRVRLADRGLARTNPLLDTVADPAGAWPTAG